MIARMYLGRTHMLCRALCARDQAHHGVCSGASASVFNNAPHRPAMPVAESEHAVLSPRVRSSGIVSKANYAPCCVQVSQQGSNPNYAKVKFQGGPGRINGVTCAGGEGESTPDGYYLWFSGLGCDAVQCTVDYDIGGGKAATIPAGLLC